MARIDIISGFLGAGKTTLIQKLLKESLQGEKVVLIENEFGEIGIDGGFLKDAGIEITEMNSGCICCSLVGDFGTALKEVIAKFSPERIIIEPSGVGKLSDVMRAVAGVEESMEEKLQNSAVTVVDATKAKIYMKNFGEFFNNQVESAKTIILSRTQNLTEEKLLSVVSLLKEKNPEATIITTPWESLEGSVILKAMEHKSSFAEEMLKEMDVCPVCGHHHDDDDDDDDDECACGHHHHHDEDEDEHEHHHHHHDDDEDEDEDEHGHHHHDEDEDEHEHEHHHHHGEGCGCGHEHHHHHADEVFTSWGKETPHVYTKDGMESILKKLSETQEYGMVLRAKGMVPAEDGSWIYFDLVPGEYELRTGSPEYTGRLCVIGSNLKEDSLNTLFEL